ncbi:MAG: DoxX family protein [Flavisolibacter sp.]
MMKAKIFYPGQQSITLDLVLFIIRLVCGYIFITTGSGKIGHPFNWMGPDSSFPGFFQFLAAISEYIGGFALILGLITRLASFGIGCTMIVAIYVMRFNYHMPFISNTGGPASDLPTLLLMMAILLFVAGPGRFSLDHLVFGRKFKIQHS